MEKKMAHTLYSIIITPIQIILEFFYQLIFEITDNKGLAVIGLSFVVSISTLPLYIVAEKWQQVERDTQARMKSGVDRIKAAFKGDEQYMILSTFYRQNHYHPMMALRSSVSLIIQIPFFIAAYNFLSNLEPLHGQSFYFIKNLGEPDASLKFAGMAINVLPIAMTLINCVAGAIYTRGFALREKLQIYGMAAIFLILLYNSPSGLVLYWTMNNVLSLAKNIFYKIKNPRSVLFALLCAASVGMIFAALFVLHSRIELRMIVICFAIMIVASPFILQAISKFFETHFTILDENKKLRTTIFLLETVSLAFLAGLVIPTTVIESEPVNFCYIDGYKSPFVFVAEPFFQATGLFLLWPLCFYILFSNKTKKTMCVLFYVLAFCTTINCFVFSGNYGALGNDLLFMQFRSFFPGIKNLIIEIFVFLATLFLIFFLFQKLVNLVKSFVLILCVVLLTVSSINIFSISKSFINMPVPELMKPDSAVFHLSKKEKNVIVFMLDSGLSLILNEVLDGQPELRKKMDGFVFYPNTVTLGHLTMLGAPGLYGGYDHTPYEINLRTDKNLQQKHNEALLTMPVLFSEKGFDITVSNLPYENYYEYPVTKMYENYPEINRCETKGKYADFWFLENGIEKKPYTSFLIKRNFIWFSFFKMVMPVFRDFVYFHKYWISYTPYKDMLSFINAYSVLDYLPELTDCSDKQKGSFILLDDDTIHEQRILQYPEYVPRENVTNAGDSAYANMLVFSTMSGVFLRLAEFFEYLKAQGVYDNTRIIIVSDHGSGDVPKSVKYYNRHSGISPILLVKDFDAHGEISEDLSFMTNADTPYLATKDIIPNAKNPFTDKPLYVENKNDYIKIACPPPESTRIRYNTKFKINANDWWTVRDNIFVPENWKHGFYE